MCFCFVLLVSLLFVCLFLHKLAFNIPGKNWAPTEITDISQPVYHAIKYWNLNLLWNVNTSHFSTVPQCSGYSELNLRCPDYQPCTKPTVLWRTLGFSLYLKFILCKILKFTRSLQEPASLGYTTGCFVSLYETTSHWVVSKWKVGRILLM